MSIEIDPATALRNQHEAKADWAFARRRLRRGVVLPIHRPRFGLRGTDTIFTMGSCFARNIEKHLVKFGCRVPTHDFALPQAERLSPVPNHALTLFTPPMFSQTIEWAERIMSRDGVVTLADCEPWLYRLPDGSALDLGLAAVRATGIERVIERRQELFDLYRAAFTAEAVIMTPGLVEAWFDNEHQIYTNSAPIKDGALLDPERYTLRVLDYAECYRALSRTVELIRHRNRNAKLLITVSPVPLRYTFTDQDILVANTYSKSLLRAVCQQISDENSNVDYFPSFEAVVLSTWRVWRRDRRHVSDAMIDRIVRTVIAEYFAGQAQFETAAISDHFSLLQRLWRSTFGGLLAR